MKQFLIIFLCTCYGSLVNACEMDSKALQQDTLRWKSDFIEQRCWQEAVALVTAQPRRWRLDLSNHHLGDENIAKWLLSLPKNAIQSLNLAGNDLYGKPSLWQALKHLGPMEALHLGYNPLDDKFCKQGLDTLALGSYKRLSLADVGSYVCQGPQLQSIVKSLEWLDISSHGGQAIDLDSWLTYLRDSPHLKTLILNHQHFSQQTFSLLMQLIDEGQSLEELALGHMSLSSSQWQMLLPAVAKLPQMKKLSLFNNQLSDGIIASLVEGLTADSPLRWLDLSQNRIGPRSMNALAKWGASSSLQHLSLRLNPLGGVNTAALQHLLLQVVHLHSLDLSHTDIDAWKSILFTLAKLQQLESLSLANNPQLSNQAQGLLIF